MSTIYEIAERTGVSPSTVSRALSGKGGMLSEETCERIEAVAQELGYRRNAFASSLRRGKFNSIGFLHSPIITHALVPVPFRAKLEAMLAEKNLLLLTGQFEEDALRQGGALPRVLREWSVDGFLLFYTHGEWPKLEVMLDRQNIPVVWVNNKLKQNSVYPDDVAGGRMAAEYLISRGHRKIGVFSFASNGHYSEADRLNAFMNASAAAGVQAFDFTAKRNYPCAERHGVCEDVLNRLNGVSALFCFGPEEVIALMVQAARKGIRIPEDLSLMLINCEHTEIASMPVDMLVMPYHGAIAQLALDGLLKQIAGGRRFRSLAVPPVLFTGETVKSVTPSVGSRRGR